MEADQEQLYDARFEFDAPRYYDFEAMSGGTPADKWFDTASDARGGQIDKPGTSRAPFKELDSNAKEQQQQAQQQLAAAAVAGVAADTTAGKPKASNIVTSWGQAAAGHKASAKAAAGAGAAAAATGPDNSKAGSSQQLQGKEARRVVSSSESSQKPAPRSEPPITRSMSRLGMPLCSPVPEDKPKYGSPPHTRSRAATQQRFYTVQKEKSASARTKQPASVQKLHHVLLPKVTKPARSTKPLTLPDEFELQTSKRCEGRPASAPQQGKSPFKPLAEKVREFQFKTPPRFKSKASKPAATNKKRSPITKAEAPRLLTGMRSRPATCKSQQEMEQEELEQLRREEFKARPLDTRVLSSSGQLGVPRVEKPRPTEPQPFHLRSDSRAKARRSHEHPTMQQAAAAAATKFKAQPLNKSILDGPTFKPHKEKVQATVPVSPELLTKRRAVTAGNPADREQQQSRPRTRSQAGVQPGSHGASAGPQQHTQPQPFRLQTEARGVQHQSEMAAKRAAEEARAKRLRRVTARPLPVTVDVPLVPPKPQPKPLTLPDPFELKSMARHEEFEQQRRTKLQQEEEEARKAAEFKARPVSTAGPFVVHESEAPLTVPVDPNLATDVRATERAEFDAHMAEKLQQQEEEKRRQEELKRQREEEAAREYRKKLRFSARPMPSFSQPFFAMPSEKPLTNPKTPNFASKKQKAP